MVNIFKQKQPAAITERRRDELLCPSCKGVIQPVGREGIITLLRSLGVQTTVQVLGMGVDLAGLIPNDAKAPYCPTCRLFFWRV